MLVLDNSVAMAWCFEDEASPYADRVLDAVVRDTAIVPALWPLEVANGLRSSVRRGRISPERARELATELRLLPVEVEPPDRARDLSTVLDLALANDLTSYDASYLELWTGDLEPGPRAPADAPVVGVSGFAARAYAAWVGKRRPTTAEWERAASAG